MLGCYPLKSGLRLVTPECFVDTGHVFHLSSDPELVSMKCRLFGGFRCILTQPQPGSIRHNTKYREIIADNLGKAGWSWGCVSAIDSNGRTIWIADAHRDDGSVLLCVQMRKLTALILPFAYLGALP